MRVERAILRYKICKEELGKEAVNLFEAFTYFFYRHPTKTIK
jgi:hypothetical protein